MANNPYLPQQQNFGFGAPRQQPNQSYGSSGFSMTSPNKDPFSSQPVYASSGGMSNPYLGAQANAITQQANQNLQNNLLPAINSGAVAAGGYGGSRQGIAQGIAMGQTQQGIANALAGMYGSAYQHDQDLANQRDIAWWQNDTATRNAQIAANASMYGADASAGASRYGSDASKAASMYGADASKAASMYGADKSSAASMYGADKSAAASMYGADASAGASRYGSDAQREASRYNADTSANIARMNNDTTYKLGMGNLGLGFQNSANSYDLGLRSNDLGYATLDANIAQNNFNNQLNGANFGLNVYNQLMNSNNLGLGAANNMQNTPLNYYSQFANLANGIGQGYGTSSQSSTATGNPLLGALGGLQLGNSLGKSLSNYFGSGSGISGISGDRGW